MSKNGHTSTGAAEAQWQRFASGDERALHYLYRHSCPVLLRYAESITGCRFEAATIVQEAVLKAWHHRTGMESLSHIHFFMRMAVRWDCLAYLKSPYHRFMQNNLCCLDDDYREALLLEAWTYISRQEEEDSKNEKREKELQNLLTGLPVGRQKILSLWSKDKKSIAQIARHFRRSNWYIINELKTTLQYLKKALDGGHTLPKHSRLWKEGFNALPPDSREMLRLRLDKGWSFIELAEHFRLPVLDLVRHYLAACEQLDAPAEKKGNKKQPLTLTTGQGQPSLPQTGGGKGTHHSGATDHPGEANRCPTPRILINSRNLKKGK